MHLVSIKIIYNLYNSVVIKVSDQIGIPERHLEPLKPSLKRSSYMYIYVFFLFFHCLI